MRLLTKGLASIVALAVAGSLSMGTVQAAAKADKPAVTATVEKAAGKKAKKAKARVAWKSCGVGKYHDKSGNCVDASAKK
jgi:hypothetical protein